MRRQQAPPFGGGNEYVVAAACRGDGIDRKLKRPQWAVKIAISRN